MTVEDQLKEMKDDFKEHQKSDANYFKDFSMDLKEVKKDISEIKELNATQATDLSWIKEHLKTNGFVKKEEFQPVRNIVYGLVAIVLTTVIGAIIRLVIM